MGFYNLNPDQIENFNHPIQAHCCEETAASGERA